MSADRTPEDRVRERLDDPELAALKALRDQVVGSDGPALSREAVRSRTRRILGLNGGDTR